jgi:hypothetical protein
VNKIYQPKIEYTPTFSHLIVIPSSKQTQKETQRQKKNPRIPVKKGSTVEKKKSKNTSKKTRKIFPSLQLLRKLRRTPGEYAFVQAESNSVLGVDPAIERSLEVTMSSQTLLDESASAATGVQRYRLEPVDVLCVSSLVPFSGEKRRGRAYPR